MGFSSSRVPHNRHEFLHVIYQLAQMYDDGLLLEYSL